MTTNTDRYRMEALQLVARGRVTVVAERLQQLAEVRAELHEVEKDRDRAAIYLYSDRHQGKFLQIFLWEAMGLTFPDYQAWRATMVARGQALVEGASLDSRLEERTIAPSIDEAATPPGGEFVSISRSDFDTLQATLNQWREVVEAACDWIADTGTCHFCGAEEGEGGTFQHDEGCPMAAVSVEDKEAEHGGE